MYTHLVRIIGCAYLSELCCPELVTDGRRIDEEGLVRIAPRALNIKLAGMK